MMKKNAMLALLAGLALVAALQTGCIITDYPAYGPDNATKHIVGCVDMKRQGTTDRVVAEAQAKMWYVPSGDPLDFVTTKISGNDARDWFYNLSNGINEDAASLYYGIGTNEPGYTKTGESSVIIRTWTFRPWLPSTVYITKWQPSLSRQNDAGVGLGPWNFTQIPESAFPSLCPPLTTPTYPGYTFNNLAGGVPSVVAVDNTAVPYDYTAATCEFQGNVKAKNVGIWDTPGFCGTGVPCSTIMEPGGDLKYTTWLMSCYNAGTARQTVLTRLPVQAKDENCTYEIGKPFNFNLKSGELSVTAMPTLNEDTGKVRLTLISGTIRGKEFRPTSPLWVDVTKDTGIAIDQTTPGYKELQKWALENVDLSKPFHTQGEMVPFLGRNLPNAWHKVGIARQ